MNKHVEFFKNPKDLVVWGTSYSACVTVKNLRKNNCKVKYLCDNDETKHNTMIYDCEVISPAQLANMRENVKIIIASVWQYNIKEQLEEMGIFDVFEFDFDPVLKQRYGIHLSNVGETYKKHEDIYENQKKISEVMDLLADEKSRNVYNAIVEFRKDFDFNRVRKIANVADLYFDENFWKWGEGEEVYVDAGVFDAGSIYSFIKFVGINNIKQIHGFEPDKQNYKNTKDILRMFPKKYTEKIELHDSALGKEKTIIKFSGEGTAGSRFDDNGKYTVEVNSLDNLFNGKKITCIKMDIEGAEIEALLGAENTIKTYKPKLAICIYHEPDHLWRIPLMIKEMVPEYSIYIRHNSSLNDAETVCYAQV